MEHEFWQKKWASNVIGFHLPDTNPILTQYWSALEPKRNETVFVPLCGKSMDLDWLAERHNSVTGVELSQIAVRAFFAERLYTPTVTQLSSTLELYEFDEFTIYSGDYFVAPIEAADLIYDRAALVALPKEMREEYVQVLRSRLKEGGRILLVTLDYDQNEMAGPPFSVPENEVQALFSGMKITRLQRDEADAEHPKIKKGLSRFAEEVWLIES
ncbi:thiopurine S-methyltransferase [Aliivibrio fischeri ES114]|uniref:Thiopurine S-methyltransferase n=1 Tax=Aliivibrio fischeri (strain ATCC 700601 / ES114) TaxID=312309 RepID=TPMT_ALIF1|nr:thiopurine S-methyltransferase [Aliivibrio fischeri]Q5E4N9.1 RecName: Full=Thiopurine S-methyltransferase; AltName: Full=Thiopurine methyltransferase [Aliivibrio fischeri ES114]AAW86007.1 thiopurine S-methyltransferase [Aliivibrio fischeri ES114]KLU79703.1 thiopurine S-methyltransferase [Aliivibrio fischeri]MCE7565216.1 thiopurine S-methyltransferase [Aliivibrio fischeri]MUK91773.1 thiopurine S-methyltransferase [Aliivibrio fischeri]